MMFQGLMMKWGLVALLIIAPIQAWWFYSSGYDAGQFDLTAEYQQAYIDQYEHYREKERGYQAKIDEIDKTLTREVFDAQETIDGIVGGIHSGERRLYIRTKSKANCEVPGDSSAASDDDGPGRSELDPDAAERIIRITERGDTAIRRLTACQEYVNSIINEQGRQSHE